MELNIKFLKNLSIDEINEPVPHIAVILNDANYTCITLFIP